MSKNTQRLGKISDVFTSKHSGLITDTLKQKFCTSSHESHQCLKMFELANKPFYTKIYGIGLKHLTRLKMASHTSKMQQINLWKFVF